MDDFFSVENVKAAIQFMNGKGLRFRQSAIDAVGLVKYNNLYSRLRTQTPIPKTYLFDFLEKIDGFSDALQKTKKAHGVDGGDKIDVILRRLEEAARRGGTSCFRCSKTGRGGT